ncbi:amidophosphoribosyltransferase [Candidatus Peregrinibacteria bacterium]|nr:amidophosphoribosyltransferase [Candidatus Peregrinibacteria bacterium]
MCGIIGILSSSPVVQDIYDGLVMLQHRGQDSSGIMTYDGRFFLKKGNGYVRDVFKVKHMIGLKGNMGIGHVRYTTAGSYDAAAEAQPFYVNSPFGIALIHNGNLTNYQELKEQVTKDNRRYLNTNSDSEILLNIIADEIGKLKSKKLSPADIFKALKNVYKRLKGSFSVICMIANHGLLAFRDKYGIRPLIFGKRESSFGPEYIFASESVALDTLGFELLNDVMPGEAVFVDLAKKVHVKQVEKYSWAPCIFEYVYLARPDSVIDRISVYKSRLRMGKYLAVQIKKAIAKGLKIDVVVPVPDTARSAAFEIASQLRLPCREGLIKNRYIGRTFIMPGQGIRKRSIKYKLNPMPLEINGKNVLLVDDSIVRGNTSRKIVEMVRDAGAKHVYMAICCPPLRHPCVYGVDMPTRKEFIANNLTIEEIAKAISADKLFYQTLPDLIKAVKAGNPKVTGFCTACFSGKYLTPEITEKVLEAAEQSRSAAALIDGGPADSEDQLSLL